MALHPKFPKSPYEVLEPEFRWFPADEALRTQGYEKLLPPLVAELRKAIKNGGTVTMKVQLILARLFLNGGLKVNM